MVANVLTGCEALPDSSLHCGLDNLGCCNQVPWLAVVSIIKKQHERSAQRQPGFKVKGFLNAIFGVVRDCCLFRANYVVLETSILQSDH